ncbi:unnamed protein product, partial [marine sediment metagenome]
VLILQTMSFSEQKEKIEKAKVFIKSGLFDKK